jgi:hypothetical protein
LKTKYREKYLDVGKEVPGKYKKLHEELCNFSNIVRAITSR